MFTFPAKSYTNSVFVIGEEIDIPQPVKIKIKPEIFLVALMFVFTSTSSPHQ